MGEGLEVGIVGILMKVGPLDVMKGNATGKDVMRNFKLAAWRGVIRTVGYMALEQVKTHMADRVSRRTGFNKGELL